MYQLEGSNNTSAACSSGNNISSPLILLSHLKCTIHQGAGNWIGELIRMMRFRLWTLGTQPAQLSSLPKQLPKTRTKKL